MHRHILIPRSLNRFDPCVCLQVLKRAPIGVYATYPGTNTNTSARKLAKLRAALPPLPPSMLPDCDCGLPHTMKRCLDEEGALHGDRVRGKAWLSPNDAGCELEVQLGGEWDIELIYDDSKENGWVSYDPVD